MNINSERKAINVLSKISKSNTRKLVVEEYAKDFFKNKYQDPELDTRFVKNFNKEKLDIFVKKLDELAKTEGKTANDILRKRDLEDMQEFKDELEFLDEVEHYRKEGWIIP